MIVVAVVVVVGAVVAGHLSLFLIVEYLCYPNTNDVEYNIA